MRDVITHSNLKVASDMHPNNPSVSVHSYRVLVNELINGFVRDAPLQLGGKREVSVAVSKADRRRVLRGGGKGHQMPPHHWHL